ncbi:MAG TPA: hypothetical protein VFO41_11245, partial [Alphaproteobacteria bacterium]|nr:hypothetical protein [Alphaproteobacteria bacterium]
MIQRALASEEIGAQNRCFGNRFGIWLKKQRIGPERRMAARERRPGRKNHEILAVYPAVLSPRHRA